MALSRAGFLQQFAGVCRPDAPDKNMATVVEQLSNGRTPTRVLCCGHSLGGALATLGAHLTPGMTAFLNCDPDVTHNMVDIAAGTVHRAH